MISYTLQRYILRELMRVFLLVTIAFTLILSLGSVLRPIQEYGVGPGQVGHLLGYFIPITLTFVLPVSAMMATALVYGRFASDNELNACRASGVSMTTLLYPGLCLAVTVAIATLVLSFHVVPAFVHRAERSIKANAKQILFRNIQRRGKYTLPDSNIVIWADHADPKTEVLSGVVLTKKDRGKVTELITAENARVQFQKQNGENSVTVVARETYQIDSDGSQFYSSKLAVSSEVKDLLSDKIKFQKIEQLKRIRANLLNFGPVRQRAVVFRSQLLTEILAEKIQEVVKSKEDNFYRLVGSEKTLLFTSAGVEIDKKDAYKINLIGPVKVLEVDNALGQLIRVNESNEGYISLEKEQIDSSLIMVLRNVNWERRDGLKSVAPISMCSFPELKIPEKIEKKLSSGNLLEIASAADVLLENKPSAKLRAAGRELNRKIRNTLNEITAEIHSRLVFGFGCIALILNAICLGIKFKGGHLLSAFGVSSIPAAVLIVSILMGTNLISKHDANIPQGFGVSVMWLTVIALYGLSIWLYRSLTRN